jgi:hypothetical protein
MKDSNKSYLDNTIEQRIDTLNAMCKTKYSTSFNEFQNAYTLTHYAYKRDELCIFSETIIPRAQILVALNKLVSKYEKGNPLRR